MNTIHGESGNLVNHFAEIHGPDASEVGIHQHLAEAHGIHGSVVMITRPSGFRTGVVNDAERYAAFHVLDHRWRFNEVIPISEEMPMPHEP